MKQEFNESVDQVAGRDIINVYSQGEQQKKEGQGYTCPYCRSYVRRGALICSGPSCGAEILYGSTRDERSRDFSIGFIVFMLITALIIYRLPIELNNRFDFELTGFWGLSMTTASIIVFVACVIGGLLNQSIKQSMRYRKPPRFIRLMRHSRY